MESEGTSLNPHPFIITRLGCPKRNRMSLSHLYLIENHHGDVKIGVSCSLKRRLRSLELAGNFDITKQFILPTQFARKFEKMVLSKFSGNRTRGEWFSGVNFETMQAYIRYEFASFVPSYDLSSIKDPKVQRRIERVLYNN